MYEDWELYDLSFDVLVHLYIGKTRVDESRRTPFWPRPIHRWRINATEFEVNIYGSMWGESLVLNLGNHLSVYRQPGSLWWALNQMISPVNPSFGPQSGKTAGSSVSGNFGEVLTILCMESMVPWPQSLSVCHISSRSGGSSPDLFLETTYLEPIYNVTFNRTRRIGNLPAFIPGECKNTGFLKGLRQLATYWTKSPVGSPDFGYGLISTIDYKQTSQVVLNFNLIIPRDKSALLSKLGTIDPADLTQADLKGELYGFG